MRAKPLAHSIAEPRLWISTLGPDQILLATASLFTEHWINTAISIQAKVAGLYTNEKLYWAGVFIPLRGVIGGEKDDLRIKSAIVYRWTLTSGNRWDMRPERYFVVLMIFLIAWPPSSLGEETASNPEQVSAKLTCSSLSSDPKEHKAFQIDLQFEVHDSLWMADRKIPEALEEEKFRGVLSPSGAMLVAGLGRSESGKKWDYEFSGNRKPGTLTILKGSFRSDEPKGTRSCSLSFRN